MSLLSHSFFGILVLALVATSWRKFVFENRARYYCFLNVHHVVDTSAHKVNVVQRNEWKVNGNWKRGLLILSTFTASLSAFPAVFQPQSLQDKESTLNFIQRIIPAAHAKNLPDSNGAVGDKIGRIESLEPIVAMQLKLRNALQELPTVSHLYFFV
jgi:hypothetical protein